MSGPLGTIPGMFFDPVRNRYFPIPKGPLPIPLSEPSTSTTSTTSVTSSSSSSPSPSLSTAHAAETPGSWSITAQPQSPSQRRFRTPDQRQAQAHAQGGGQRRWADTANINVPAVTSSWTGVSFTGPCSPTNATGAREKGKRSIYEVWDDGRMTRGLDMGARVRRCRVGKFGAKSDRQLKTDESILKNLELKLEHQACGCHGETVTSYKSYGPEAYCATTDHGKVIMNNRQGNTTVISVCAQNLIGLHSDLARLTIMAVAGGADPHLHYFKRDPDNLNFAFMTHSQLDLCQGDIYSMSSFDDSCVLGGTKSLTTVHYTSRLSTTHRKLPSDVLALHQNSHDVVYVGLRSGVVMMEDLRTKSHSGNVVAGTKKGKAVVGVRRLDDAAVPWGLALSGMGHELLLYDVRYGSGPMRELDGHVNTFLTSLSLTSSPDDKYVFASGSDRRVRAWSTLTGQPLISEASCPDPRQDPNPLVKVYDSKVSHLAVRDDLGLDVVVGGELLRYGRKGL